MSAGHNEGSEAAVLHPSSVTQVGAFRRNNRGPTAMPSNETEEDRPWELNPLFYALSVAAVLALLLRRQGFDCCTTLSSALERFAAFTPLRQPLELSCTFIFHREMEMNKRHSWPGHEDAPRENWRLRPEAEEALAEIREILFRELVNANSGQHATAGPPPSGRWSGPRSRDPVSDIERGHLDTVDDVVPGQTVASLPVQFGSSPTAAVILTLNGSPDASPVGDFPLWPTNQSSPRELCDDEDDVSEPRHVANAFASRDFAMCLCSIVCFLLFLITLAAVALYSFFSRSEKKMG
ncbi:hypothetical protein MRX96_000571 [Rhipicephalus microplus]